jgi:uncharacterized protein RhaS with RHS repeats
MRARYYDPEVGRFISEDPIGFDGGDVNLMAYVQNNPVNLVDPLGTINWIGAAVGGIVGGITGGLGTYISGESNGVRPQHSTRMWTTRRGMA